MPWQTLVMSESLTFDNNGHYGDKHIKLTYFVQKMTKYYTKHNYFFVLLIKYIWSDHEVISTLYLEIQIILSLQILGWSTTTQDYCAILYMTKFLSFSESPWWELHLYRQTWKINSFWEYLTTQKSLLVFHTKNSIIFHV